MKRKILVIGASSKLGESLCNKIDKNKWEIIGTYNSKKPTIHHSKLIKCDITSTGNIASIFEKEKNIDCMVVAVGKSISGSFANTTKEELLNLLNINVIGPFNILKSCIPSMSKNSKILIVSSLNGFISLPNFSAYSASKHALDALMTSINYETSKNNINITIISPGAFKNEKNENNIKTHKPIRERIKIIDTLLPIPDVNDMAEKIYELIELKRLPSHVNIGRDSNILWFMKKFFPSSFVEKIVNI